MIAFSYFLQGGPFGMGLLTLMLIGLCLAAWKAPAWVTNIGKIACAFSILYALLGTLGALQGVVAAKGVPFWLLCSGLSTGLIPVIYGLFIYIVSQIIAIVQKPRI